ncbi:ammonium transporter [Bremerella sp. JC817]|uniref:ammonium transporter n=1 Tax=Bremerella sp. JC817 TaxID=3231756 RepID=UPI00345756FA
MPSRRNLYLIVSLLTVGSLVVGGSQAFAQADLAAPVAAVEAAPAVDATADGHALIDYAWVIFAAALVMLMQAGFMCLESGLARAKNSINVAVKNMADFVLSVAGFWFIGFGLMFGTTYYGLFGTTDFCVSFENSPWLAVFFVFQATFCGTAATIDSGAVAERSRFVTYLFISLITSALIYPVFGHWAWGSLYHSDSSGWLEDMGFIDFAGSTVVHSVGAWVALASVIIIGPRLGRFNEDGTANRFHPHNLPLMYLGTFILVFGWFGFNCGSTLAVDAEVGPIAMTTLLSACFGGLSSTLISWSLGSAKLPQAEDIANGVLGGLVGITAGCASVSATGAVLIGLVSGVLVFLGMILMEKVLKLDDVVGAIPVHGFCGAWGTIAVGFFAREDVLTGASMTRWDLIGVQAIGVAACFVWTFCTGFALVYLLKCVTHVRVSEEDEIMGLNVSEHGAKSTLFDLAATMQQAAHAEHIDRRFLVEPEIGTEAGDLAQAFNRLIEAIDSERHRTRDAVQSLERQKSLAQAGLARYKHQVESSLESIDEQRNSLQSVVETSSTNAQRLVSSVQQIFARIDTMVRSLGDISQQMQKTASLAERGVATASSSGATMSQLNESSTEIESVLDMVREVAEQTNLLALNATIEAARAGAAGKGFAVVATEVKQLSRASAESTQQISGQISRIRSDTREVASNLSETANVIGQVCAMNDEMNRFLQNTSTDQRASAEQVRQIGSEIEQMVEQMLKGMQEIRVSSETIGHRVRNSYQEFTTVLDQAGLA